MPPDLNSLPPSSPLAATTPTATSPTLTQSPPVSHTLPPSLAAAAAMNAGIQHEERRPSAGSMRRDVERARRRSSIRMNLNLNDPTLPAPGELQQSPSSRPPWPRSPHHERAPSLGDLHQELEYEQEGQVNRLLTMIRQQQAQIVSLQTNQPPTSAIIDEGTPTSERSLSLPQSQPQSQPQPQPNTAQTPASTVPPRSRSPLGPSTYGGLSRHSSFADRSRGSSHMGSPALRPVSRGVGPHESTEWLPGSAHGASRDEGVFYQAETQMLTRENQMLKLRIRELERQLTEQNPTSGITHSPATASSLHTSLSVSQQGTQPNPGNPEPANAGN